MRTNTAIIGLVLAVAIIGAGVYIATQNGSDYPEIGHEVHWEYIGETIEVHQKGIIVPKDTPTEKLIEDNFVDQNDAKLFTEKELRTLDCVQLWFESVKALEQSDKWQRCASISATYDGVEVRYLAYILVNTKDSGAYSHYYVVSGYDEGSLKVNDPMWTKVG